MGSVPVWPRALGIAGLLPQIAFALLALFAAEEWRELARGGGALYASLILTFLGGAWWGIAAGAPAAERRGSLSWLWIAAVLPSLFAWALLALWLWDFLALEPILVMLGAALLVALGVDWRLASLAPRWWMHLRAPLSIGLGLLTFALALA